MKFLRINIVLLLIVATSLSICNAQNIVSSEYAYRQFTTQNGLPTNMVENIFQDSQGYLWFATEHGISRYDGHHFKTYMANKSLPINKIEENERGEIVIYGYYFINILNPETEKLRRTFSNLNLNYLVNCSSGLPSGYSMISKRDLGKNAIFHLEADTLREVFYHPLLDKMDEGQSVYYDLENKVVYILTQENKVYIVDFKGNILQKFDNIEVCRFLKNGKELWAIGLEGVWTVSPKNISQKIRFPHKIKTLEDIDAIFDSDNNLIIRDDNSVFRYKNGQFETLIAGVNLPRNFMFDNEGNFWLVSRSGIFNFFHLDVKIYKINDDGDLLRQILPVDNHNGYLTTANGNLIHYFEDNFTKINYPKHPQGTSFSESSLKFDDILYFTTYQDILKLKNGHFSWLNLPPNLYHITASRFEKDKWIVGGWNTLWILDKEGKYLGKMSQRELNRNTFYCVASDRNKNIWIGGHSGICRINQQDTLYFFSDTTMNAESVDVDKNGTICFACEGNIYRSEGDKIRHFMSFDDEVFYNIRATDDDLLVLSSSKDLRIVDIATKRVVTYDYSNGLSDCEPSWATMAKDFEGNIWLGTQSPNVLKFNPKTLFERKFTARLQIEKIESSANNVDWQKVKDFEKLDYKHKNLKINFIALCFSNPNAVRYRYRLLGFQDEWSVPTTDNEVVFNNLANGNYEFQVIADCGDENTQTQILSRHFYIKPAVWQSAWFIILCIIILMTASAGIAIFFLQRKNKILLGKIEVEKQINELKISSIRLKAIPHFNANVLAAIEYYILNRSKEEAIAVLGTYSAFTFQTLQEVDKASRSLSAEIDYVKMYLDLEKLRFGKKFEYIIEIDKDVNQSIQLPNMILHTWAENAVKHAFACKNSGGILLIKAVQGENFINVSVSDNGAGRQAAVANKNVRSTKQGLSILERQIEIYNRFNKQKIKVFVEDLFENDKAAGTKFSIEIPMTYTYEVTM